MDLYPHWNPVSFTRTDFDKILLWCAQAGAADIVFKSNEKVYVIADDEMHAVSPTNVQRDSLFRVIKTIRNESATSNVLAGDPIDFGYLVEGADRQVFRFRVNATAVKGTLGATNEIVMTMRAIADMPPKVEDLGVEKELSDAFDAHTGIIIVAGATGSGKSTLCASLIRQQAETRRKHIVTYESPVEYDLSTIENPMSLVDQSEVPSQVSSFYEGIRNSLRRKPHILFVGEARDGETISAAIRAAATGHLVVTTVHSTDVPTTIARMVDEFEPEKRRGVTANLLATIRCIAHQQLAARPEGGRVALREFLTFDDAKRAKLQVALASSEAEMYAELRTQLAASGQTLLNDAAKKLAEGLISEDLYRAICIEAGAEVRDCA